MAVAPAEPAAAPAAPVTPPAPAPAAPPAPPAPGLGHVAPPAPPPAPGEPPAPPAPKTRPEWLGEKYWDATKGEAKLEDLAKAEAAWRAQISRADHKPPATAADYKLDFASHTDPDIKAAAAALIVPGEDGSPDPIMKAVQEAAHKTGVSQAGLQAITEAFLKGQAALLPEPFDEKAEMAKLGQNGPALVKTLQDYAAQQLQTGRWDDADAERFRNYLFDAGDAQFLYKFLFDTGQVPEVKIAALSQAASTPDAATLDAEQAAIGTDLAAGKITEAQANQRFAENLAKREKLYGKEAQRSWPPPAA
jgi:hypothetical protein